MDEIIRYLEETYALTDDDLILDDDERWLLRGQRQMIQAVKDLHEHGIPEKEVDDD